MSKISTVDTIYSMPADGDNGKFPYPAGKYSASVEYKSNSYMTPYVVCGEQYYVLVSERAIGVYPPTDYANNGGHWQLMEKYKAIFVEMMIANLGKLGAAVFYGQYMFSQYGKIGNVVIDCEGGYDKPIEAGGEFDANLLVDFLSGYLKCNNADIRGKIEALSGKFGDLIIVDSHFESASGKLHFGQASDNYTFISTSTEEISRNANIYVSNATGSYGMVITARETCLKLSGKKSIEADGAFSFLSGNGGTRSGVKSGNGYVDIRCGNVVLRFSGTSIGSFSINAYKEDSSGNLTFVKNIANG